MLSDPNVKKILPKVGNRYEAALAIAKRARDIENRRVIEGDTENTVGKELRRSSISVRVTKKVTNHSRFKLPQPLWKR